MNLLQPPKLLHTKHPSLCDLRLKPIKMHFLSVDYKSHLYIPDLDFPFAFKVLLNGQNHISIHPFIFNSFIQLLPV